MACKDKSSYDNHKHHNHHSHEGHDHSQHEFPSNSGNHDHFIEKYLQEISEISVDPIKSNSKENMVLIAGGQFSMGGDFQALEDELPKHQVKVNAFYLDKSEITNQQYFEFVSATGYQTTAEREIDLEEIKAQLPEGYDLPPGFDPTPMSLVFKELERGEMANPNTWWKVVQGANWRHPQGPASNATKLLKYPAVHLSWFDAKSYCTWRGKRLPTEAEWEFAARGKQENKNYPWGNDPITKEKANYWQGEFPYSNDGTDGYHGLAPVQQFPPNAYGLYDMAGNVWEWCEDWYDYQFYKTIDSELTINPKGPNQSFDPQEPTVPKKVIRGGSFLCNDSYCSGYRVSARMKSSPDTGLEHTGCRCAADAE